MSEPNDALKRTTDAATAFIRAAVAEEMKYLLANGWTNPDGVGYYWAHDSLRDDISTDLIVIHHDSALEIQARRDSGWKIGS